MTRNADVATPLFARRLQLVTGKGGVGKTTLVAAMAVECARVGRRPLIVEMGHRASLEGVFDAARVTYAPSMVAPGVHAMNLDMDGALLDYVASHVLFRGVARQLLASGPIRAFSSAAPAVMEMATLDKLRALLAETEPHPRRHGATQPRWDPILVDLDATGHALMFLDLPRTLQALTATGPLAALLARVTALLEDATTTALHLVTLPNALPLHETVELYERLRTTHRVPLGGLFVNRVPSLAADTPHATDATDAADPHPRDAARFAELAIRATALGLDDVASDLTLAERAARAHDAAHARIRDLRIRIRLPLVELPTLALVQGHALGPLAALGAAAVRGLAGADA